MDRMPARVSERKRHGVAEADPFGRSEVLNTFHSQSDSAELMSGAYVSHNRGTASIISCAS